MNEKIIIVSAGIESGLIGKSIAHLIPDDVIIVDVNNIKEQLPFPQSEPFILRNPYPPEIKKIYEGKQFVCKGKHEYRLAETIKKEMANGSLVTEIWKCQCGKVLG